MDQTTPSLQDIQNKIRTAATARGIDPDIALSIANVESQFSNTTKNTLSSARGLFQIVDDTWDRFGGDSKLRNDIDENIRVGIKVIAASRDSYLKKYGVEPNKKEAYGLHFFGPLAFKIFSSNKNKPMKDIVPNDVLEANPFLKKMNQADLMNFLQTKMAKPIAGASRTTVSKNEAPVPMPQAPKETMRQAPTKMPSSRTVDLSTATNPTAPPMNKDLLASLGPSYQAALGAITLADTAEDDEDDELLMEKYAERFGDQTVDVPITSALSNVQLTYTSPFEEPAPVQMSKGGDPSIPFPMDMSIDDIPEMPPNPTPEQEAEFFRKVEEMDANAYWKRRGPNSADELNYSPSRKMLDEFKSNMPTGETTNGSDVGVQEMAFGGIPYKPSAIIPSEVKDQVGQAQADLEAYNQQVGSYNTQLEDYTRRVEDYNAKASAYNEQRDRYFSSYIGGEKPTVHVSSRGSYRPIGGGGTAIPVNARNLNVVPYGNIPGSDKIPGYIIRQGEYRSLEKPTDPGNAPGGEPTAPVQPDVSATQASVAAAKDKQRRLQLTYDVLEDPERFNLSMPAMFATGGEALPELGSSSAKDMQDYLNSSVSGNKDVLQGMVGGQAAEGIDARLIGTYMQSLPPKFARQFLLNLELAKKAGINLTKEGVANIYANIANGDTNYQIGYSPTQKSVNLSRMEGNSGIGLNIGRDNVGLNYTSGFAVGGEAKSGAELATYTVVPNSAAADYEKYLQFMKGVKNQQNMSSEQRNQAMSIRSKILDPITAETLDKKGIYNSPMLPREITAQNSPTTLFAGIPGAKVLESTGLKDSSTRGFIMAPTSEGHMRTEDLIFIAPPLSQRARNILYKKIPDRINPNENPELSQRATLAHEAEHLLKRRAGVDINDTFDNLTQQARDENYIGSLFKKPAFALRKQFVDDAKTVVPYLMDKFKLSLPSSFAPDAEPNDFHEQVAALMGLEETFGVDLTQDPFLRGTLFNDADVRRAFRAITGLRQTRLDAKDLAPYTLTPDAPYYPDASKIRNRTRAPSGSTGVNFIEAKNVGAPVPYVSPMPFPFQEIQNKIRAAGAAAGNRTPTPVKRAGGSPVYGEEMDQSNSGSINADTRAALTNYEDFKNFSPREAFNMFNKIGSEGLSNFESRARGTLATIPGTVGDIGQDFNIRGLRELPTTEQWLKKYPQRLTQPTAEAEGFTNIGTYIPPPPAVVSGTAKVVSGTAKALMKGLKESGPQVENIMRKIAPGSEPFYILRPTGGDFLTNNKINDANAVGISMLDKLIAQLPNPSLITLTHQRYASSFVNKFFETKIRDYFKKQAGSVSDPVREALISGKIKIPKGSALEDVYPEALIKAAREGDVTAMRLIERQLDEGLNLRTYSLQDTRLSRGDEIASDETRLFILQQMKRNPDIIPDAMLLRLTKKNASNLSPKEATKKVADIRAKLKTNPELFSTIFEEKIMEMISQSKKMTDVVTPEFIEDFPTLYGKLKNAVEERKGIMSLKDSAPFIDIDPTRQPTLFGMDFKKLYDLAQRLPEKELERMDLPTMLNKVIQLNTIDNEVADYANKAKKLISAGKAVPEKITTYGTKPFMAADNQGFMWREITDPSAATIQAKLLGNSIGEYAKPGTYGALSKGRRALDSGEVRLFSLFDRNNQVMTQVEYVTDKAERMKNMIPNFFGNGPGTGNVPPRNLAPQVEQLVKKLNPDVIPTSIQDLLRDNGIFITK